MAVLNRVGRLRRPTPFSVEALLEAARRRTGLSDFGDSLFLEPLQVLLGSIHAEADLHALGRLIERRRLLDTLTNRLRAEALFSRHPEIAEIDVGEVLVIAGLQRTGTTYLHRLLAADPATRALRSWEALHPAPLGGGRRLRIAQRAERGLRYLAPEFFAVHPVEAEAPEEDVLLLDLAFMSQTPEAMMHVPEYAAWLEEQDQRPAYRYLRRMLQLLQWQRPGPGRPCRWVLKTPHHLEHLDALFDVFPEARIVQTHRDPASSLPSFCSMVAHARAILSDRVEPREVARHWSRKTRRMLERSLTVRAATPDRFLDVAYRDLLADAGGEVRRIYRFARLAWDAEVEEAVTASRRHNVKDRFGRHRYALADFGLSPALIDRDFGAYRQRFGLAAENGDGGAKRIFAAAGESTATGVGHKNPLSAVLTALADLRRRDGSLPSLGPGDRLDGKTCLITGATSGLGRAVAADLAHRGARLILAVRSGIPEVGDELRRQSGNDAVGMRHVDLADLDSVTALADELRDAGERLDVVVLNAGIMPRRARPSVQGHELMFAVHFLANALLLRRLLGDGTVANRVFHGDGTGAEPARIVFVSSEAHKSAPPIDFDRFGVWADYGLLGGMARYGESKLLQTAWAAELARRLAGEDGVDVSVSALCPGPVASRLAREAPLLAKPLLAAVMSLFFRRPEDAAAPVVYLAAAPELRGQTGLYLHMMRPKPAAKEATDPEVGRRIWAATEELLRPYLPPG